VLTLPAGDGFTRRSVPSSNSDYRDFYSNVRDAILKSEPLAVSPQWACDVMRLLELSRESIKKRATLLL
jgi:hypothetical protein